MHRLAQVPLQLAIGLAACALAVSLAVHLVTFAGVSPPGGNILFGALGVGMFVLAVPTILVARQIPDDDQAIAALPKRMRYAMRAFDFYVMANVAVSGYFAHGLTHTFGGAPPTVLAWHGFASVWMGMFFHMLRVLLTALHQGRCRNRHAVAPDVRTNA